MKLLLHSPQNIQTNEQYLKFDDIYGSTKTFACLSVKNFEFKKELLFCFLLCSKYIQYDF